MIRIHNGNTRFVLILFRTLVFKFPRISLSKLATSNPFCGWYWRCLYAELLSGLLVNLSEAGIYMKLRWDYKWQVPFLSPTLSLFICNIQGYEGESIPTVQEFDWFVSFLSPECRGALDFSLQHELGRKNWRKTKKGWRLIDFGPMNSLDPDLFMFLRRFSHELTSATGRM